MSPSPKEAMMGLLGAGTRSSRAICSFVRGVVVGSTETLLGGTAESDETSCIAMGDAYCQFEVRRKP